MGRSVAEVMFEEIDSDLCVNKYKVKKEEKGEKVGNEDERKGE